MGITPQQYAQLQQRLGNIRRTTKLVEPPVLPSVSQEHRVVLGIDPSLRGTGYGIIRVAKPHPHTLAQGTIKCPATWPRSRCLVRIADTLREVLRQHQPTVCAMEALFYAQNLQTTLMMGEARGVCMLSAAEAGMDIYEIAPRKVKLALVGYGAAQKLAVAKMVQRLLYLPHPPVADAADALAVALAYIHENRAYSLTPLKPI